jgi:valyl-tRNA synthetase
MIDVKTEEQMGYIIEAIKALRNARVEMNVPPSRKAKVMAYVGEELKDTFIKGRLYFEKLASASELELLTSKDNIPDNAVSVVVKGGELFMPLLDLVDRDKEIERLNKEKEKLLNEIDRVQKKLTNERFVSKAPKEVVDEEKAKGDKYRSMLEAVLQRIESLK